jgi:acetyltransferase-like isoleucine patch superfamily enzyme
MTAFKKVLRAATDRPFYLWHYACETASFAVNDLAARIVSGPGVRLGRDLHVRNAFCFMAERPEASIEVGDHFTGYCKCSVAAWGKGRVRIGDWCNMGSRTQIDCREAVTIGSHVLISWEVMIADYNPHPMDPAERRLEMEHSKRQLLPRFDRSGGPDDYQPRFSSAPITIGDDVWIGARAVILKGVTVGRGSVIGAGAVVTRDVEPYTVVAGNPAVKVKDIQAKQSSGRTKI